MSWKILIKPQHSASTESAASHNQDGAYVEVVQQS